MSVTRKPAKENHHDKLINSIINKGGSSPINFDEDKNNHIKITVRLPQKMLNIIDLYLEESISKQTRTHWLREAAEEKIERDINKRNL